MDKSDYETFRKKYCVECDPVITSLCNQTEEEIDEYIASMAGLYNSMDDGACC